MADEIPFPFEANAGEAITEAITYATDVLTAYDGTEQRIRLRHHPAGRLDFSVLCEGAAARRLMALLHLGQGAAWAVPLWPFAQKLAATLSAGATVVPVPEKDYHYFTDLTQRGQPYAMLWKDWETWELLSLTDAQPSYPNTLPLATPTQAEWAAGTKVLPVRVARLGPEVAVSWETREAVSARLSFSFDATGTRYAAFADVLYPETLYYEPNRDGPVPDSFHRRIAVLDSGIGARWSDVQSIEPDMSRVFVWTAGPTTYPQYPGPLFIHRRILSQFGRGLPLWVPTWERDLELVGDQSENSTQIAVAGTDYMDLWAAGPSRRHLRIYNAAGLTQDVGVAGVEVDGDATLCHLDQPLWQEVKAAEWLVCFLRLCRFDTDEVAMEWRTPEVAEARIKLRELPLEAPIPEEYIIP